MNDRDCENCKHHTEKGCDSWDCNFEQRMTRKEIIEMLKVLKNQALKSHNDTAIIDVKKDSFIYVMNVTINSLEIDERYELEYEQIEPCEDVVSRQQVKSDYADWFGYGYEDNWFYKHLSNIPPVNPQEPRKGYLSIDDVMSVFDDFMCGEVDEDGTETFLEMLKDKAESEG